MRPLFVGLIVSAIVLNFINATGAHATAPIDHTVTEENNGREVRVAPGDIVTVKLGAQLGTGYGWQVVSGPGRRLQQIDKRPKIESNKGSVPGNSEVEVFRFAARQAGRVRLELLYLRPREKREAALKTFRIFIVIG